MENQTQPKFEFIAGQLCLDFINTEIRPHGERVDLLKSFYDLLQWQVEAGLLEAETAAQAGREWGDTPQGEDALVQARRFRRTLREMVEQIIDGQAVAPGAVDEINRFLKVRSGYRQLARAGEGFAGKFLYLPTEPIHLLGPIAETALDLLCEADLSLLKRCGSGTCIRLFYDTTKNHSRRWCSMESCGNRVKVAAYYERKRRGD